MRRVFPHVFVFSAWFCLIFRWNCVRILAKNSLYMPICLNNARDFAEIATVYLEFTINKTMWQMVQMTMSSLFARTLITPENQPSGCGNCDVYGITVHYGCHFFPSGLFLSLTRNGAHLCAVACLFTASINLSSPIFNFICYFKIT
jgi:hypothetical protein